jgi:putative inorganic carbon (HCO3(-)) transporter
MLAGKETNKIIKLGTDRHGLRGKRLFSLLLVAIVGFVYGSLIFLVGGQADKWLLVIAVPACFFMLVRTIGSLKKALLALLIFSLSMEMDTHLLWSGRYTDVQPGIPVTLTAVLLAASYLFWFFDFRQQIYSIRLFAWITLPFGLLALWSGLSFIVAEQNSYVLNKVPRALTNFFLYFYVANYVKSKEDIYFILKCIAVTVALSGLLGICQYILGDSFNLQFMGGREAQLQIDGFVGISRVSGLLRHSNIFAWFMGCFLPLLLISGVGLEKFHMRLLCLVSFTFGLMSNLLTYSRGSWLAFLVSIFLMVSFLIAKRSNSKFRKVLVRIILLSVVSTVLISPFFPKIIHRITIDDYSAAYSRIPLAQTALRIIKQNPLMGIGLGNYSYVAPSYDPNPIVNEAGNPLSVHNIYLHIASELGIPALGIFMWVLAAFFANGIFALSRNDEIIRLIALGSIAGLAVLCLHGMVEPGNLGHHRFSVISFIGGLLVALAQSVEQVRPTHFAIGKGKY